MFAQQSYLSRRIRHPCGAGNSSNVSVAFSNNLGHDVARNTIKNILLAHGIEPAPERGRHTSWHTFIESHLGAIAGADFFTVEVLRGFGLVRYYVLFVIDIGTRRVHVAGITKRDAQGVRRDSRAITGAELKPEFLRGKMDSVSMRRMSVTCEPTR
jgi:hypothetical protein